MGGGRRPSYPAATNNDGQLVAALQMFGLQLVSGGGAGAISKTSVAPIERIKVILQVERGSSSGAVSVATTILRTQGIRAFWRVRWHQIVARAVRLYSLFSDLTACCCIRACHRCDWQGNGVNVLRIIPNAAIKFSCNDTFKAMYACRVASSLQALLAGSHYS
jgi:hypothetical protein